MSELKLNETNSTEFEPGHPFTIEDGQVDVFELRGHQDNTYVMDPLEIDSLAENIKMIGLITPLTVRRVTDGGLQILSGHRRARALRKLAKEDERFRTVPVRIYEGLSDQDALLILHSANITRKMSQDERKRQTKELEARVKSLRASHPEWKGVLTTDIIAHMLGMSGRTYRRKVRFARELEPRIHQYLDRSLIKRDDADMLARLPLEKQVKVADALDKAEPKNRNESSGVISQATKDLAQYQRDFEASFRALESAWFELRDAERRTGGRAYLDLDGLRRIRAQIDAFLKE